MNDIQCFIDRQLGIYCRFTYDNILKRLVVSEEESFYGLQSAGVPSAVEHDPPIFACRFSEAAGYEHILALANEDGRVAIQDISSRRSASALDGFQCHNNAVFDLAWMPHHMNFVTVSGDHTACLWDIAEGSPRRLLVFAHHTRSVKTAVFRPGEPSVFATGARDGHILVWDIRAAGPPGAPGPAAGAPALVVKPDNCLASCHASGAPKTPGSHGKRPRIDAPRAVSITGLVFRDDCTLVSCGECDGNIKLWDLRKSYNVYKREPLPKHSIPYCGSSTRNGYTNLAVDDARTRLYASCMDNVIYCFNVAAPTALPERRYVGHESGTFYIKAGLSPDGEYLVSGSSDKHAYVWNVRGAEPVVRLAGHRAEVTCAAWGPRGDTALVTCGDDARHMIWRVGREPLDPPERDRDRPLQGRAELVPRADACLPRWGRLDRTPGGLKRKVAAPASSGGKRMRAPDAGSAAPVRRTKRCLTDLMNGSRDATDAELLAKRLKLEGRADDEPRLLAAGSKRPRAPDDRATPPRDAPAAAPAADWTYPSPAGSAFLTPTKNYEKRPCKRLSPRSPRRTSPPGPPRSPGEGSPAKVRIVTFSTPTKNLPNFVVDGEAPHHRLMSPVKKKRDAPDWLTLMSRGRRGRAAEGGGGAAAGGERGGGVPLSPRENLPARRSSQSERGKGGRSKTLLKYFTVAPKDKDLTRIRE